MSFASNVGHLNLGDGVYNNVHGNYIVHNIFYGRKRHREEIDDGPGSLSIMEPTPKRRRREEDSEDGIKVLRNKDLKLTAEIGSGLGYFLHAGEIKGRAVIVKVFNPGPSVREHLESTVALSKGFMHPNVLRIEGVSSPAALTHFIAYENAHWKTAEGPLAAALKEDLTRSITLGFKMIAGLSSGMNHLSVQGISLAPLGVENFDIFLDVNDRFLISINPHMSTAGDSADDPEPEYHTRKSWDVFNALCQKVLRSANRVLHNEDIQRNPLILDLTRRRSDPQISLGLPSSPSSQSLQFSEASSSENPSVRQSPVPPRREYVWRTIERGQQSLATVGSRIALDLDFKLLSVNKFAWTDGRSPHRCAGYVREEITLATRMNDSAVVSHDVPSPLEICSVCHEVVGVQEEFRCICGDTNPGSRPTVKCRECRAWSHSDCIGNSKEFTCQFCMTRHREELGLFYTDPRSRSKPLHEERVDEDPLPANAHMAWPAPSSSHYSAAKQVASNDEADTPYIAPVESSADGTPATLEGIPVSLASRWPLVLNDNDEAPLAVNATGEKIIAYKPRQYTLTASRIRRRYADATQPQNSFHSNYDEQHVQLTRKREVWKTRALTLRSLLRSHGVPCREFQDYAHAMWPIEPSPHTRKPFDSNRDEETVTREKEVWKMRALTASQLLRSHGICCPEFD
ncbi:hypothetical protein FB451DRAFT_139611 [Mycena latifolia]|nr:hypothetical protein FB451DRAFT_139611 [Mycena latifolia]